MGRRSLNDQTLFLSMIVELCKQHGSPAAGWHVPSGPDASQWWIGLHHERARTPEQGWKLHVSAGLGSAETVLRRALPVLLAEDASFKVVASLEKLAGLNNGFAELSQIGKFITVYPNDDDQAVRLAVALDAATDGLRGPAIPSDRPLAPGSLVHYRYGSFGTSCVQEPGTPPLPAIRTPAGNLVPDVRDTIFCPPDWAVDPFIGAGVAVDLPAPSPLIGGRYLIMKTIHETARGTISWAVDITGPRRCILKRAARDAQLGFDGRDARDRLRMEAAVLARLAPDPRFPSVIGLIEQDGDLFLAMEDVDGTPLDRHVAKIVRQGRTVPGKQVVAWGRELAAVLETVHARGFVYRDVKSSNVIVAPDGRLRLVDFDVAHEAGTADVLPGFGTHGYRSPQQRAGEAPTMLDDVYGLGALLYFAVTGVDPALAPRPFALLDRPPTRVNPAIDPALAQAIARCLEPNPPRRFPSPAALDAAFAAAGQAASVTPPPFGKTLDDESGEATRRRARDLARRLADRIGAETGLGRDGALGGSRPGGIPHRDLYQGSAGTLLALTEVAAALGDAESRARVTVMAGRLATMPRPEGRPVTGLYIGEAGVAAALLRAGQVLGDGRLIATAAEWGRWIATLPDAGPDLMNGMAGRLRFHLWLWDETADPEHRRDAVEAGESLLASAEDAGAGGVRWSIPPGYAAMSGKAFLGYAHGAAGIADALLDLFEATGGERFCAAARGAGRWLASLAVPALDDGSGLNWPRVEGREPSDCFWCHGATGIGRFFLHAAQLDVMPGAGDIAARAGRTAARGARWAGVTQCHGLAGNIEFLLDLFQATGERSYLVESLSLARLLEAQIVDPDGSLIWRSESPELFNPDYMAGYAGVVTCLLRLSDPERVPHQLSRRGFRYQPVPLAIDCS